MRKDIEFPKVENVFVAITKKEEGSWEVNLVNENDFPLTTVLIVSKGYGTKDKEKQETSTLRHAFEEVPPQSSILIEPITEEVFHLFNEYWVSYYANGNLLDKKFIFPPDSVTEDNQTSVPIMGVKGILHE